MKHIRRFFIIIFVIFILIILYSAWDIISYSRHVKLVKADAAIVLGAAAWGVKPSPVFKERINHAIWLYKKRYVKKIIFTGAKVSESDIPESIVARRYAIKYSIPQSDILVETKSKTTRQNLYYANILAQRNNLKKFLIVSDPLHMKRAILIARDLKMDAYQSPTPTTRFKSWGKKLQFLAREVYFYIKWLTIDTCQLTGKS